MNIEKAKKIQKVYEVTRVILIVVLLCLIGMAAKAETTDDFGMWTTVDVQKSLGQKWTVGGGMELRTKNANMDIDRWQIALNANYKLSRYFKLGAVYELHLKQFKVNNDAVCGVRHRGMADITGSIKANSWLKLSLRERYEYTHRMERTGVTSSDDYQWRSRLKLDYDKKDVKWAPFVSFEAFDDLADNFRFNEMRLAAGTVYKFNSHHSINLGYLLDRKWGASGSTSNIHVITSGYTYKF